ncbi:MAG: hypothetical protein Aurels2KO_07830 [Aureliella sp.]
MARPLNSLLTVASQHKISRRRALLVAGLSALPIATTNAADKARKGLLARSADVESIQSRSKIVLELDGVLKFKEPNPKEGEALRSAEVKGKSTLEYYERSVLADAQAFAASRDFTIARTENWVDGSASSFELDDKHRKIAAINNEGQWKQYCPSASLSHREVELIAAPVNTACLELLLPTEPAKPDASWKLSAEDAASVFNIEAVHKSEVTSRVTKVENGKATIEIKGSLDGTANSVPTHIDVKGSYQVSMGKQCALVTWVGIVLKEERSISAMEPGFTVTARVRILRQEATREGLLSRDELAQLASKDDPGRWLTKLESLSGGYSMLADRRWKMFADSGNQAILRMVENNMVIAQCNILHLAELEEGQQLTLEGLQADIKAELGESFEQFLESSEKLNAANLRVIRVVAMGTREDVPIQWIYSHISDDSGKRIALVYTMGGNVTDRFAASDEQMTTTFKLVQRPTDDAPKSAPLLSQKPEKDVR